MNKLKDIYQIYIEILDSKTFGNLYKTDKYSLELINLFLTIPISTIEEELSKKQERLISELTTKPYYSTLIQIINLLSVKKEIVEPPDNYLLIENNKLKFNLTDELEVGCLVEVYDETYLLIGKAIVLDLDHNFKLATLNYFLTIENSVPKYAYFKKWWDIIPQEVTWLKSDAFIPNNLSSATLEVHHKLNRYKLGRVQWEFYYRETDNEVLIARGVDITQAGLITITKSNVLFKEGNYRLAIVDRRVMYNAPIKSELNWEIETSTSKIFKHEN